jgi:hypothetical protein
MARSIVNEKESLRPTSGIWLGAECTVEMHIVFCEPIFDGVERCIRLSTSTGD